MDMSVVVPNLTTHTWLHASSMAIFPLKNDETDSTIVWLGVITLSALFVTRRHKRLVS